MYRTQLVTPVTGRSLPVRFLSVTGMVCTGTRNYLPGCRTGISLLLYGVYRSWSVQYGSPRARCSKLACPSRSTIPSGAGGASESGRLISMSGTRQEGGQWSSPPAASPMQYIASRASSPWLEASQEALDLHNRLLQESSPVPVLTATASETGSLPSWVSSLPRLKRRESRTLDAAGSMRPSERNRERYHKVVRQRDAALAERDAALAEVRALREENEALRALKASHVPDVVKRFMKETARKYAMEKQEAVAAAVAAERALHQSGRQHISCHVEGLHIEVPSAECPASPECTQTMAPASSTVSGASGIGVCSTLAPDGTTLTSQADLLAPVAAPAAPEMKIELVPVVPAAVPVVAPAAAPAAPPLNMEPVTSPMATSASTSVLISTVGATAPAGEQSMKHSNKLPPMTAVDPLGGVRRFQYSCEHCNATLRFPLSLQWGSEEASVVVGTQCAKCNADLQIRCFRDGTTAIACLHAPVAFMRLLHRRPPPAPEDEGRLPAVTVGSAQEPLRASIDVLPMLQPTGTGERDADSVSVPVSTFSPRTWALFRRTPDRPGRKGALARKFSRATSR